MIPFICYLAIVVLPDGRFWVARPTIPDNAARLLDPDAFRRIQLERLRRARAMIESNVEMFEMILREAPELFPAERARQLPEDIEHIRQAVERYKKRERELWEMQPGGITAPPPREKK